MRTCIGATSWEQKKGKGSCGCLDAAAMRAAILENAARTFPNFAFVCGGLRVAGVRPDRCQFERATRAHFWCRIHATWNVAAGLSLPCGRQVVTCGNARCPLALGPAVRSAGIRPTLCRRAISSCDPTGSYRSLPNARIQAPDLSETRPSGLPEAPQGPSGEGRAPRRVRLAPLDYRTRTLGAYCPRSPGAAGRPQCRQPEARNARRRPVRFTCELSWPSTMRCVCRAAASPSSIYRGNPRY